MCTSFQEDAFYRPSDDALRLIATEGTLAQWRSQGTGPQFIKLAQGRGSRVLYSGADLLAWLTEKRVPGPAQA